MKSSATPATPKPSQDPRALRVVGGGRGTWGEGGDYQDWRGGAGEMMGATEMGFYGGVMHTNMHELAAKKKQGKIRAMQSHGQVMPPWDCIAKIAAEEC